MGDGESDVPNLGLKDYLALAIAALETLLLPLVILVILLFVLTLFFTGHL